MEMLNPGTTRYQIVIKSLPSFVQKGLHGLTLSDLSRALGMSKPSILYHFDGPDDIFISLMDLWAESGTRVTVRSLQRFLGSQPQDVIVGVMHATFDWLDAEEDFARLTNAVILAAQSNVVVRKNLDRLFSGGRGRIRELLQMSTKKLPSEELVSASLVLHSQIVGALIYEMLSSESKVQKRRLRKAQLETFRKTVADYFLKT